MVFNKMKLFTILDSEAAEAESLGLFEDKIEALVSDLKMKDEVIEENLMALKEVVKNKDGVFMAENGKCYPFFYEIENVHEGEVSLHDFCYKIRPIIKVEAYVHENQIYTPFKRNRITFFRPYFREEFEENIHIGDKLRFYIDEEWKELTVVKTERVKDDYWTTFDNGLEVDENFLFDFAKLSDGSRCRAYVDFKQISNQVVLIKNKIDGLEKDCSKMYEVVDKLPLRAKKKREALDLRIKKAIAMKAYDEDVYDFLKNKLDWSYEKKDQEKFEKELNELDLKASKIEFEIERKEGDSDSVIYISGKAIKKAKKAWTEKEQEEAIANFDFEEKLKHYDEILSRGQYHYSSKVVTMVYRRPVESAWVSVRKSYADVYRMMEKIPLESENRIKCEEMARILYEKEKGIEESCKLWREIMHPKKS